MKQKIVKCPVCGTPCIIQGIGDFHDKDKANTLHYQPISELQSEQTAFKKEQFFTKESEVRLKKLENIIKARLNYCQQRNGLPYCKNCGLDEDDLK